MTLRWTSFSNGVYRVEYRPVLSAAEWAALEPAITATGKTTSFTDASVGNAERYYRVVLSQ